MPHPETAATEPSYAERLARLEEKLDRLLQLVIDQRTIKDWYTVEEAAKILGKAAYTVREWCRDGRVHARKREQPVGLHAEWVISHAEIERYRNEGLLPVVRRTTQTLALRPPG